MGAVRWAYEQEIDIVLTDGIGQAFCPKCNDSESCERFALDLG
jgi:hypothetical protein